MQISAKADQAVRALLELAAREPETVTAESVAAALGLPRRSVVSLLADLRRADLVRASRGSTGGYVPARPARTISLGDVVRAVDGPDALGVEGVAVASDAARHLPHVWDALGVGVRRILDATTLHDVVTGDLPGPVRRLVEPHDAF